MLTKIITKCKKITDNNCMSIHGSIIDVLIIKIPTYSLKKIVVPRRMNIFLLFGIILYFGLILIYTFNTIVISGFIYLIMIPISIAHYYRSNKKFKTQFDDNEDHEDIL